MARGRPEISASLEGRNIDEGGRIKSSSRKTLFQQVRSFYSSPPVLVMLASIGVEVTICAGYPSALGVQEPTKRSLTRPAGLEGGSDIS